jgi:catechol 2,3-dioxygenase-like lactoylglutathione lyase family enzyme
MWLSTAKIREAQQPFEGGKMFMGNTRIVFDHVHLISEDPQSAASWYADKLGGKITSSNEVLGAPQIYVAFENVFLIIRGRRPGEQMDRKQGLHWGTDHFGFQIYGDFDGFCDALKTKGVIFSVEPRDFSPTVRIAFIEAPDGVRIELIIRKG